MIMSTQSVEMVIVQCTMHCVAAVTNGIIITWCYADLTRSIKLLPDQGDHVDFLFAPTSRHLRSHPSKCCSLIIGIISVANWL